MDRIGEAATALLGLGTDGDELGVVQMGLRAVVVYVVTVAIVRLAKKRFMGRASAFDVILGIMLGSVVSRAITGNAPLGPPPAAAAAPPAARWLLSAPAFRRHGPGAAPKGRPRLLARAGEPDRAAMRRARMSEHDPREDLRARGVSRLEEVAEARLGRGGEVSVVEAEARAEGGRGRGGRGCADRPRRAALRAPGAAWHATPRLRAPAKARAAAMARGRPRRGPGTDETGARRESRLLARVPAGTRGRTGVRRPGRRSTRRCRPPSRSRCSAA
jgi:uncharacterized membrane protein YcaP (DUF421 family)